MATGLHDTASLSIQSLPLNPHHSLSIQIDLPIQSPFSYEIYYKFCTHIPRKTFPDFGLWKSPVGRIQSAVCVGCLFLWTPSRIPYGTPLACANRAAYPDPPPPVVPHPESIDAQAAYRGRHSTIARLSPARSVSRHWGPPRACHRVPCCE